MIQFMEKFHDSGQVSLAINAYFVALIPKKAALESLTNYRPISLIGSVYKMLSKVLSIRLQRVLGEVIGDSQYAFTKGKHILDCALIANEVVHSLKLSKKKGAIWKIDFKKAYDSIEGSYL